MRILVLSDLYPPHYKGGHEIQCKVVADELSKRGHEIFVLTSRYGINRKEIGNKIFRLLYFCSVGNATGFRRRKKQIIMAVLTRLNYFITKKIIKYVNPDIVYAGKTLNISIYPMKAIQSHGMPIVHHLGNFFFVGLVRVCIMEPNPVKRFYRKIIFGFSSLDKFDFSHIITVSEAVKKKHTEVGFSESNITVIPRGISSELINRKFREITALSEREIKLLYAGRITKEKGVDIAIESVGYLINRLKVKNLILDIIGEGSKEYNRKLQDTIDDIGIEGYVKFKEKIPRNELLKIYKDYDIVLFPSTCEDSFAGVLIEAMSQGVPIIATNTGGTPELITHGWNGLLVPPNDSIKLAESIKKLIDNHTLYQQIRINGIKKVLEKYTNDKIVEQIDEYISNVSNQSKRNLI
jgi:glycosyltransferase involved in cell wall biosynthesis